MNKTVTAHDIASGPELYNRRVRIGRNDWECLGYARTGRTIKFARLVDSGNGKLRQITTYVKPDRAIGLLPEVPKKPINKFEKNTVSVDAVVRNTGMNEIRRLINDSHSRPFMTRSELLRIAGGRERVNRQGKMTKRIKRNLRRERNITLPDSVIEQIGNIMDQNSLTARDYIVEYTNDFDGTVGNFGDDGSCFQDGNEFHHNLLAMAANHRQFSAFRVYRANGDNLARAWAHHATDGATVLFNGYGIALDKIALLASKLDDCEPRRVTLYGDICLNERDAEAVGGDQSQYRFEIHPSRYRNDDTYW